MSKQKLLISSCLAGQKVRYDANDNLIDDFDKLEKYFDLVYICPEVEGGMSIPRPACEIKSFTPLLIMDKNNNDNSSFFIKGAKKALELCQNFDIKYALLKSKSPSCGNTQIYDGNFNGTLINAMGITSKILSQNGIIVFNEKQLEDLYELTRK